MLHIATSGNINRSLSSLAINIVGAPSIPGTFDQEPYQMRIRAALLAAEIIQGGEIRLIPMDSILATLITSVQDRWLIYSKQSSEYCTMAVVHEENVIIAAMGQGLLFQTLLMLHA